MIMPDKLTPRELLFSMIIISLGIVIFILGLIFNSLLLGGIGFGFAYSPFFMIDFK